MALAFHAGMVPVVGISRTTSPDGRFLIMRNEGGDTGSGTEPTLVLVQNWFEELKRLVPVR